MATDLTCPICGSGLSWYRSGDSSIGQAECQDGMGVSRRIPNKTLPCLWVGGKVVLDRAGPIGWADGVVPLGTVDVRFLWARIADSQGAVIGYSTHAGRGGGVWHLWWGPSTWWLEPKEDGPWGWEPAVIYDAPEQRSTEPPFEWACARIRAVTLAG